MPEKHRSKKGGDAGRLPDCFRIRKSARSLLDFKDGLTAGEIKLLLAVATGASLAAIHGRQFVEKFPDLAAVLGMGRGARPQRATETRRGAQNRAEAVEGSRGSPERRDALRGAAGCPRRKRLARTAAKVVRFYTFPADAGTWRR